MSAFLNSSLSVILSLLLILGPMPLRADDPVPDEDPCSEEVAGYAEFDDELRIETDDDETVISLDDDFEEGVDGSGIELDDSGVELDESGIIVVEDEEDVLPQVSESIVAPSGDDVDIVSFLKGINASPVDSIQIDDSPLEVDEADESSFVVVDGDVNGRAPRVRATGSVTKHTIWVKFGEADLRRFNSIADFLAVHPRGSLEGAHKLVVYKAKRHFFSRRVSGQGGILLKPLDTVEDLGTTLRGPIEISYGHRSVLYRSLYDFERQNPLGALNYEGSATIYSIAMKRTGTIIKRRVGSVADVVVKQEDHIRTLQIDGPNQRQRRMTRNSFVASAALLLLVGVFFVWRPTPDNLGGQLAQIISQSGEEDSLAYEGPVTLDLSLFDSQAQEEEPVEEETAPVELEVEEEPVEEDVDPPAEVPEEPVEEEPAVEEPAPVPVAPEPDEPMEAEPVKSEAATAATPAPSRPKRQVLFDAQAGGDNSQETKKPDVEKTIEEALDTLGLAPNSASFFGVEVGEGEKIVFMIDVSSSMAAEVFGVVQKELIRSIQALPDGVEFNVVTFGSKAKSVFGKLQPANATYRNEASSFVAKLSADASNTKMTQGLKRSMAYGPDVIFLLTDGQNDVDFPAYLTSISGQPVRINPIGIEGNINEPLMSGMASDFGGQFVKLKRNNN